MATVGAVLGSLGLGGLAAVQGVLVAGDLVTTAVVAGAHVGARAADALVVLAAGHDGAGEGAVRVQGGGSTGARAVVKAVGVLAEAVVTAVVACFSKNLKTIVSPVFTMVLMGWTRMYEYWWFTGTENRSEKEKCSPR